MPVKVMPLTVPVPPTEVTDPAPLPLNIDQSVDVRYPFDVALAAAMLITGVDPPDDTTGAVAVTEVTVPTLIEPPKLTVVPLITIDELANWVLEMVPLRSVVGTVVEAVIADVPLPLTYPVRVEAPVPPLATTKTPPKVIDPAVGVAGVRPVVPPLKNVTPPATPLVADVKRP